MGDDENRPQKAIPATVKAMVVDTRSGRIQVYPGIKNRQPPPLVSWYSLPSFRKSAVCFLLLDVEVTAGNTTASNHAPVGHFKIPHLWSPKIPQAGRVDYQLTEGFCANRVAASLSR